MIMLNLIKTCGLLLLLALAAGCETTFKPSGLEPVPEIRHGILQGYIPMNSLPDSLALIPPAPTEGSARQVRDIQISEKSLALQGSPRFDLAASDNHLGFPEAAATFSCALNAPVTQKDTPQLYRLLRRTLADAGLSTYTAKNHYQRTRPFVLNGRPTCAPDDETALSKDGSYPSGHTAIGWAWALILSEISPEQTNALLARGRAYGQSRVVCNVHWQSDVIEGRFMGAAAVARLHSEPAFLSAINEAKVEIEKVRALGLPPLRDCAAEAAALSG
jgi:acid phosphatase (class A)